MFFCVYFCVEKRGKAEGGELNMCWTPSMGEISFWILFEHEEQVMPSMVKVACILLLPERVTGTNGLVSWIVTSNPISSISSFIVFMSIFWSL